MIMEPFEIKRFIDFWKGDDTFRDLFLNSPSIALKNHGIHHGAESLHPFCLEQYDKGNLGLKGIQDISGLEAYRALLHQRTRQLLEVYSTKFTNFTFSSWRLRQINYFRTQVPDEWAARNPHLPMAVELTHGCSMSCPFCAGSTGYLDSNIPKFHEYINQFSSLLRRIKQFLGLKKSPGMLYNFTEPFDSPDYEDFLRKAKSILKGNIQTTTAAWFRDVPRTRAFLKLAHDLNIPYSRFSINSKKLFHKCMEAFTSQELVNVGLVYNYPQAAETYLYAAGRAKNIPSATLGSVACVTGFMVNLPLQRIQLVSPTLEIDKWPKGYRVLEEAYGLDTKDIDTFLTTCHSKHFNKVLNDNSRIRMRKDLDLVSEDGHWYLINHYRRFPVSIEEKYLFNLIIQARTVRDILACGISGLTSNQVFARLSTWWANGLLDDQVP